MSLWTDAHLHLQDPRLGDPGAVIAGLRAAGVVAGMVNATHPEDWEQVEAVVEAAGPGFRPAYGVHPWQAHRVPSGWLGRLECRLRHDPRATVGEIGLDGWVDEPSLEIQREVFVAQWDLAQDLGRAVTIHALKAWEHLFEVFDAHPPRVPFLMHSFGGSLETARRLLPLGAYFSFSGYFLQDRKAKVVEVFRALPRDRILVETDAPDMLPPESFISQPLADGANHPANLPAIGSGFAALLGLSTEALASLTRENAERLFGKG